MTEEVFESMDDKEGRGGQELGVERVRKQMRGMREEEYNAMYIRVHTFM